MINISSIRNILIAAALSCAILSPSYADDTEIFFGQSEDAFETNPNILFVLDVSGSMGDKSLKQDNVATTRLSRMQEAMRLLLQPLSNYNMGMMAFQGRNGGASVRYPIGDLDTDTSEFCPEEGCPDESITVRPQDGNDDAVQNNNDLTMSLNDDFLIIGNVDSNTVNNQIAGSSTTADDSFDDTDNAELVTKSYRVGSGTQENEILEDPPFRYLYRKSAASNWFHQSDNEDESLILYQFGNIDIPRNVRITDASITFRVAPDVRNRGEVSAFITGEQTANPTALPSNTNSLPRVVERLEENNRTNAIVSWDQIPGTAENPAGSNGEIVTPNLNEIVSEIINLPAWEAGNNMSFIVSPGDDYLGTIENNRSIWGRNAVGRNRPVLSITYEPLVGDDLNIRTTNIESTTHVDEFIHQNDSSVWRNTTNLVSDLFHVGAGNDPRQLALRFPNVDVPSGATIESVFLRLGIPDNQIGSSADSTAYGSPASDWQLVQGSSNEPFGAVDGSRSGPIDIDVTLNIHSELSADPLADSDTPISDLQRPRTDFISWTTRETDAINDRLTSPNLRSVVQETISLDEWQNGSTLSLIIAPNGNYLDNADNILRIITANGRIKPELEITYSVPEEAGTNTSADYTTAVRFRNVHVPPGATIESARLIMHAAAVNGESADFSINGELTPNSEAFTGENNDIGARTPTLATTTWPVESWDAVGNEQTSVPINNIISEITSQSDWCGGNALTLMIDGSSGSSGSSVHRFAQSVERDPTNAPALEIVYSTDGVPTDGYCSNTSVIIAAAEETDDGSQNLNSGSVSLSDIYLSTARSELETGNNAIGLRFDGVQLPQGAEITSAAIEFVAAADMPDDLSMSISMQQGFDAQPFSTTSNQDKIGGRSYTNSVNWDHPGGLVTTDSLFTSDITELLKNAIDHPQWQPGNAVAFKIEANSGVLDVVSNDGDKSFAPRLILYFQTLRIEPGSQHRLQLQQAVDDLVAQGATPIVSSLYEAANYMIGREVDFGTKRGEKANQAHTKRVSHPGSYEGGSVSRDAQCSDSNLGSTRCSSEEINHTPTPAVYKSPINSQCQSTHIVILSDGGANGDIEHRDRVENLIGGSCANPSNLDEVCGLELASWLNNTDHSRDLAGDQTIQTHTIGFNLDEPEFLIEMARRGGGQFRPAGTASELLGAFRSIINNVSDRNAGFVAPAAAVSQFNRLRNSNDIYYAMFQPSGSARWQGNLKRYAIGTATNEDTGEEEFALFGANGNEAVDLDTGTFDSSARSFWSSVTDGDEVELGGAAEQLDFNYTLRNVYTYNTAQGDTDLTAKVNEFDPSNATLKREALNLPPLVSGDTAAVDKIIRWAKGADVDDQDGDRDTTELRQYLGDPLHAAPLVTNYDDGESVIYMATNEGFLHALDTDSGKEHFAFIPEDLYSNIYRYYQNESTSNRPYGLDGGVTLWHEDKNQDGLIDQDGTETAILYIAMRRGGNSYYALDVSDYENPKYLWSIKGGEISGEDGDTTTAEGDYRELSATWSLPVKTKIVDRSEVKDVIIFAGGYSQNQDPTDDVIIDGVPVITEDVRKPDGIGRAIFIANAETGELIWQTDHNDSDFSDMEYSIPSRVRSIDVNFDGIIDQLYVGDTGGQLWRLDFNNSRVSTDSIDTRIQGFVFASVAGDNPHDNRKFYYPPDVAVINLGGEQQLSISIGTGWRAHPLDTIVDDRMYSFRTPFVFGSPINSLGGRAKISPIMEGPRLLDVTDDINAKVGPEHSGWYIRFDNAGEKVVGSSLTFNDQLLFTSYEPEGSGFSCDAAIGSGSVYALNIFNGAPILNLDNIGDGDLTKNDRSRKLASPGLPPEVSVTFPEIGSGSEMDGDPLFQVGKETIPELDGGNIAQTTFWHEVTENHDE